jgi:hypothetical protein
MAEGRVVGVEGFGFATGIISFRTVCSRRFILDLTPPNMVIGKGMWGFVSVCKGKICTCKPRRMLHREKSVGMQGER